MHFVPNLRVILPNGRSIRGDAAVLIRHRASNGLYRLLFNKADKRWWCSLTNTTNHCWMCWKKMLNLWNRTEILKAFYSVFERADYLFALCVPDGHTGFRKSACSVGLTSLKTSACTSQMRHSAASLKKNCTRSLPSPFTLWPLAENCTDEEMKQLLKQHYDGYHFSEQMTDIYNPFSILNAFDAKKIRDFWFATRYTHLPHSIDEPFSRRY